MTNAATREASRGRRLEHLWCRERLMNRPASGCAVRFVLEVKAWKTVELLGAASNVHRVSVQATGFPFLVCLHRWCRSRRTQTLPLPPINAWQRAAQHPTLLHGLLAFTLMSPKEGEEELPDEIGVNRRLGADLQRNATVDDCLLLRSSSFQGNSQHVSLISGTFELCPCRQTPTRPLA